MGSLLRRRLCRRLTLMRAYWQVRLLTLANCQRSGSGHGDSDMILRCAGVTFPGPSWRLLLMFILPGFPDVGR